MMKSKVCNRVSKKKRAITQIFEKRKKKIQRLDTPLQYKKKVYLYLFIKKLRKKVFKNSANFFIPILV